MAGFDVIIEGVTDGSLRRLFRSQTVQAVVGARDETCRRIVDLQQTITFVVSVNRVGSIRIRRNRASIQRIVHVRRRLELAVFEEGKRKASRVEVTTI